LIMSGALVRLHRLFMECLEVRPRFRKRPFTRWIYPNRVQARKLLFASVTSVPVRFLSSTVRMRSASCQRVYRPATGEPQWNVLRLQSLHSSFWWALSVWCY